MGLLEISYFGNEDGIMDKDNRTGRRYSADEKAAAVRMVRTLRAELGTDRGTAGSVALQLGYGVESVRSWVRQADIDDGVKQGVASDSAAEIRRLEQELREMKRANEILKRAASFFGAELDRQHKM
jgi:transposase